MHRYGLKNGNCDHGEGVTGINQGPEAHIQAWIPRTWATIDTTAVSLHDQMDIRVTTCG